jgi:hypothetical protein
MLREVNLQGLSVSRCYWELVHIDDQYVGVAIRLTLTCMIPSLSVTLRLICSNYVRIVPS